MAPLLIDDYDYPLPDDRIARYPVSPRDSSRLLVYRDGRIDEDVFRRVGDWLMPDALLVYNNTRVLHARLVFRKENRQEDGQQGARIEVFCLEPAAPRDYALSLGSTEGCTWKCMVGNLKKWKQGALCLTVRMSGSVLLTFRAERLSSEGNTHLVRFTWDNPAFSFAEILDTLGELPIPPYLNRPTEAGDAVSYQTVYSRIRGSVAAPTAGLHFTNRVLDGLRQRGIQTAEVTLHVGAGTFWPVKTADANLHVMHSETIVVSRETLQQIRASLGRIVAVGTTSMRTLESLYFLKPLLEGADAGTLLHVPQFMPYEQDFGYTPAEALDALLAFLDRTGQDVLHAETQIMIRPGYRFRMVDQLITNFHQPKSTLLLLVSAFVGGDWRRIYDYALARGFRFLSYGDSSVLTRRDAGRDDKMFLS
jgi:S-adenosylmethionine:tRNA ribosyltransferase-isomerase